VDPADADLRSLTSWVGRTSQGADQVTAAPARALAATLDHETAPFAQGTPLPPLWHWLYFLPVHRASELGDDGHARRGGFLPPVPLPRRMWAGSRFVFVAPLCVGDSVMRVSTIEAVQPKTGRHGPLVFVTVRHDLNRDDETLLTEWHDIVYRPATGPGDGPADTLAAPAEAQWRDSLLPDDVLLFRYSALTFNGHRIHYDRRYATEVEGYPGLVVHGPLIATLLLDRLRRARPGAVPCGFEFRAHRPAFDGRPLQLCGRVDGHVALLWALDAGGALLMQARATLRP
jgi:3-methylfumaryl-CoA hydratase